jgi:hypothetical protein
MQRHLGHVVGIILQRALALARETYLSFHQPIQGIKARHFAAGPLDQVLFFILLELKGKIP